jgi:hypothetical protein
LAGRRARLSAIRIARVMKKQSDHAAVVAMKRFFLRERACGQCAFWLRLWLWASRRAHVKATL